MLTLPADSRFDPWRDAGADLTQAKQDALDVPPISAGVHPYSVQLLPGAGAVLRGTLDPSGAKLTTLDFTKSLYELYGKGTNGPADSPGYSYPPSKALISILTGRVIVCDLKIRMPARVTPKHHYEPGFHALYSKAQLIGWNLELSNVDTGAILAGTNDHLKDITLRWEATRTPTEGRVHHYGVCHQGIRPVTEGLRVKGKGWHDIDIQGAEWGVFKDIAGYDLAISFHATKTDEEDDHNLFTGLRVGTGGKFITATGAAANLPWTGDFSTFHDVRYGTPDLPGNPVPKSRWPAFVHPVFIDEAMPPPPPPMQFYTVKTTALVNVRAQPSKTSALIGTQPVGAKGTSPLQVTHDDPHDLDYVFVNFVSGGDGYVDAAKLVRI